MIPSPQIQNFTLLLDVFRKGLKIGLISIEEIVSWADNIIANTDEPDYFFIELSLSGDVNSLIDVLNRYVLPTDDPICDRVLLGLIYHRKPISEVEEIEGVAIIVGSMSTYHNLTSFEDTIIYEFDDYYMYYLPDYTQLQVELINFLGIYKAFTLENYEQWITINKQVLQLLEEEETRVNIVNESIRKAWAKKEKKRKLILYLKRTGVVVLVFIFFGLLYSVPDSGREHYFHLWFILLFLLLKLAYSRWFGAKQ